jgi:hypothetical protein
MQLKKSLVTTFALALGLALSPLASLQAASPIGPGTQPVIGSMSHTVQAEKKDATKKAPAKKAKAKKAPAKKAPAKKTKE